MVLNIFANYICKIHRYPAQYEFPSRYRRKSAGICKLKHFIGSHILLSKGFQVKPCIEKSVHLGNTMDATSSTHKEKICVLRDRALMAALELTV